MSFALSNKMDLTVLIMMQVHLDCYNGMKLLLDHDKTLMHAKLDDSSTLLSHMASQSMIRLFINRIAEFNIQYAAVRTLFIHAVIRKDRGTVTAFINAAAQKGQKFKLYQLVDINGDNVMAIVNKIRYDSGDWQLGELIWSICKMGEPTWDLKPVSAQQ